MAPALLKQMSVAQLECRTAARQGHLSCIGLSDAWQVIPALLNEIERYPIRCRAAARRNHLPCTGLLVLCTTHTGSRTLGHPFGRMTLVDRAGIEPATPGFSVLCSTN